jgi:hypothetical protein
MAGLHLLVLCILSSLGIRSNRRSCHEPIQAPPFNHPSRCDGLSDYLPDSQHLDMYPQGREEGIGVHM